MNLFFVIGLDTVLSLQLAYCPITTARAIGLANMLHLFDKFDHLGNVFDDRWRYTRSGAELKGDFSIL